MTVEWILHERPNLYVPPLPEGKAPPNPAQSVGSLGISSAPMEKSARPACRARAERKQGPRVASRPKPSELLFVQ